MTQQLHCWVSIPEKWKSFHIKTYTLMFIEALFVIAKKLKQPVMA